MADDSAPPTPPTGRKHRTGLFVTDAELVERLGVPARIARQALRTLDGDRRQGFPQKQGFWGGRRYWPACKEWLDARYGNGLFSQGKKP